MKEQTDIYASKEEIKNRILRTASDFWGLTNIEQLDPLVKLLLEALSTEVFHIANDVRELENRVFNRMTEILAPVSLVSPLPAHLVLQAYPVEAQEKLSIDSSFYVKKEIKVDKDQSKISVIDLFFSPLTSVRIFHASVAYIACGNTLYAQQRGGDKVAIGYAKAGADLAGNTVYLGVNVGTLKSLRGLIFHFNWRSYLPKEGMADLIPLAKWSCNGFSIETSSNLFFKNELQRGYKVLADRHLMNQTMIEICQYYKNNFITLTDSSLDDITNMKKVCPEEFLDHFDEELLGSLTDGVLWFKIVFPAGVERSFLKELDIAANAFPVMNKKRVVQKNRVNRTALVPLALNETEQFLSVQAVEDLNGVLYHEFPSVEDDNQNREGTYTLRFGGVERFDVREAAEILELLIDLLHGEKKAFASFGNDFLNSVLESLEQNLARIDKLISSNAVKGKMFSIYLDVNIVDNADLLYLSFFVTNAELANGIRVGTQFLPHGHNLVRSESVRCLSTSVGGRSKLKKADRVHAYRYGLTSGNRIVSKTDIVHFCLYELGDKICDVRLKRGLTISANPKEGWVKTIDVLLYPSETVNLNMEEWEDMLRITRAKLESRSVMQDHYRLLLAQ